MRIGIIGSGDVGQTLGSAFLAEGYEVKLGSRSPGQERVQHWLAKEGAVASVGTFADVTQYADIIFLAVRWDGAKSALDLAGTHALAGKILVDVTNPLDFSFGTIPRLAIGHSDSGGECVQRWVPEAQVVKAFNSVGSPHMYKPKFSEIPDMLIAGNNEEAKRTVGELLLKFGWNPIDMGNIEASRLIEPLAMLWILYAVQTNTWNHAWKLLKK